MGVLEAFMSTWSKARDTFGQGVPQTGERFDQSGPLRQMQTTVDSAAPGSRWSGAAANAYSTANADHGKVFGNLAALDQRLGAQVTQSANIVQNGRENLDAVRKWVIDAAASVPPGKNRESMLMPIVRKGLGDLQDVMTTSNGQLNTVAGEVKKIGSEYQALGNQKFGAKEGIGDDTLGVTGKGEPTPEEMEELVHKALNGDKGAAAKVDSILDTIQPNQLESHSVPGQAHKVPADPLSPVQGELISQMQSQMAGKSLDELGGIKNSLGESGDIVADSMQVMSDPDVKFPLAIDDQFKDMTPPGLNTGAVAGGKGMLPQSVQAAMTAQAVNREIASPDATVPVTTYPSGDDLKKVAELIHSGDARFQQGSELDSTMMDRAVEVLHGADRENAEHFLSSNQQGDSIVQDVFNSAGRDHVVSHDLITAPNSDFLDTVAHHQWSDDGQSVNTLTDWVHGDANSQNIDAATRAGETANSLSTYLGGHGGDLLKIDHVTGPFTHSDTTVGGMNPALVQGWADALDPYQKAMLGDGTMPGYHALPGVAESDFQNMRNVFAAIDSDPSAATRFNGTAFEHILDYQNTHDHNDLANAGALLGVVDSASLQEANAHGLNNFNAQHDAYEWKKAALGVAMDHHFDKLPLGGDLMKDLVAQSLLGDEPTPQSVAENVQTRTVAAVMNETNYQIAQDIVASDPNRGEMQQYMDGNRLMTPDEYAAIHPDGLRNYYIDMGEYVGNRGFSNAMETLYREYQNAGGINMPRPPGA